MLGARAGGLDVSAPLLGGKLDEQPRDFGGVDRLCGLSMTASTPCSEFPNDLGSVRSTPSPRLNPTTWWPSRPATATTWAPTNPVAPATAMRRDCRPRPGIPGRGILGRGVPGLAMI